VVQTDNLKRRDSDSDSDGDGDIVKPELRVCFWSENET
jgi:hypothetical protein